MWVVLRTAVGQPKVERWVGRMKEELNTDGQKYEKCDILL
jgi:hypothetical protein